MIISIERGLFPLKERLEQRGYKTVYADEWAHPADAYIHAGRSGQSPIAMIYGSIDAPGALYSAGISHGSRQTTGVIEINASEKSFEEIELELSRRMRGSYF